LYVEFFAEIIERLGFSKYIQVAVHDAYTWSKTNPNEKWVKSSIKAYNNLKMKPYIIPILPGSAPSYLFTRKLKIPMISTGPGHGGRAHAPNEYITIDAIPKIAQYTAALIHQISLDFSHS